MTERERWLRAVRQCTCNHGVSLVDRCETCDAEFDADEREMGRAALREFGKDLPRRPMTDAERLFFDDHKRRRDAGEIRTESSEERAAARVGHDRSAERP